MEKFRTPLHKLLVFPFVYKWVQNLFGSSRVYLSFMEEYVKIQPHERVLDLGCGPATLLDYFPRTVEYVGVDINPKYIEVAKKKFGNRGNFICSDVANSESQADHNSFDVVILMGLLHHISDEDASKLMAYSKKVLKKGGRIVTLDPVICSGQTFLQRFFVTKDRGGFVRGTQEYLDILSKHFKSVEYRVTSALLRLPYTQIIMHAT